MKFFAGMHHPSSARHVPRACISVNANDPDEALRFWREIQHAPAQLPLFV